jgi:hypothetical protein
VTRRVPDRLWVPAVAGLLLALTFVVAVAVRADGDLSLLVHAGPPWTDPDAAPGSLTVQPADEAFDGQFFYRLGVDPLSDEEQVAGVTFDVPSVRWGRWGYGALAFGLSGADTDLVPEALVAINIVAAAALGAVGGGLARAFGRHAAWGALFVLWPGFAYSISVDTAELLATTFALGGLLAGHHRRWALAGVLLAAGVLTRDSTVVIAAGVGALGLLRLIGGRDVEPGRPARRWQGPFAAGAAVGISYVAWQLVARARFGKLPSTEAGALNLGAPMVDLVAAVTEALVPSGGEEAFRLLSFVGLFALTGAGAWSWWTVRRRVGEDLRGRADEGILGAAWLAWLPSVAVVALMTDYVLAGATSFMRTSAEVAVLSMLLLLAAAPRRLLALAVAGSGGLWLLTAAAQVAKLG